MIKLKDMELLTRLYKVKIPNEVNEFDWKFVLPIVKELDKIEKKNYLIYSHYTNDKRENAPAVNYLRFRIIGFIDIINHFEKIEKKYIKKLGYEIDNDEFSFEIISNKYKMDEKEMINLFEFWDMAARFKLKLIESWNKGFDTHYALNTLGFSGQVSIQVTKGSETLDIFYPEENYFVKRNLPTKKNSH